TPLLLIINELLTNTIKYAFPHNEKGTINLTLKSQENNLILTYFDNGIGIPETIDIHNSKTLGLTLINSLTSQINGTLQLTKNPKTTYTITFKEQKYKKRT
ncbi:sensor histidine kinase, partial [Methanobacterium aggregans]